MKSFKAFFLGLLLSMVGTSHAQFFYDTNDQGLSILLPIQFTFTNDVTLADGQLYFSILNAFSADQTNPKTVYLDGSVNNMIVANGDVIGGSVGLGIVQLDLVSSFKTGSNPTGTNSAGIDAKSLSFSTGLFYDYNYTFHTGETLTIQPITHTYGWYTSGLGTSLFYAEYPPDSINSATTVVMHNSAGNLLGTAAVPEPSTYALFGIGAIGMLMVMRRKKTA